MRLIGKHALSLGLATLTATGAFATWTGSARSAATRSARELDYHQDIFYAVLEGLYADGVQNEAVEQNKTTGCNQQGNQDDIEHLRADRRTRPRPVDLVVALETFRGQFIGPGHGDGENKTDRQDDDRIANRPVAETEGRENRLHQLHDQPGEHQVCGAHPEYVSALQFFEKRHRDNAPS